MVLLDNKHKGHFPQTVSQVVPPPWLVFPHFVSGGPASWDPEGEAVSTLNQSSEPGAALSPGTEEEALRWYALHTRARHERVVEHRLREQGMETFLPTMQEVHRWSDREKKVDVPLFNCYVFVRCSLGAEDRTQIYRVDSILGVVGSRGVGLPIPDEQIDSVRTLLAQKSPWRAHPFLKAGQRVRVRGGAMDGVEGVFVSENGDHSLVISVDVIQRSLAVRIDGYDVEPV
jgi:transcription antitermination factor NusG